MLSTSTIHLLRQFNIPVARPQDFISGLHLMNLVSQVFYDGNTQVLLPKLRISDQTKTGNNVLNINIILNNLKKNINIEITHEIKNITAFQLIENQQTMVSFIEWIISQYRPKTDNIGISPPKEPDNEFDNLYFVSSLQKKNNIMDDSLEQQSKEQKVVRKGSFKVLKPKASSTGQKSINNQNSQRRIDENVSAKQLLYEEQPLREINRNNTVQQYAEDHDDMNIRKTIPKMYEKPPLYRSKQKDSSEKSILVPPKDTISTNEWKTKQVLRKEQILKNIQSLKGEIQEQEKSITVLNNANATVPLHSRHNKPQTKAVFKQTIAQVEDSKKKILIEWLININILNARSSKCLETLHSVCKDGVIFMEIMNYYKGRGQELCYFKAPKRTAEMHSNYQKLFNAAQNIQEFTSELIHKYEYFIPEPQPNAFWSFLNTFHVCFYRQLKVADQNVNRYSNQVSRRVQRQASTQKVANDSMSYNEIKFNSSSLQKEQKKKPLKTHSSLQVPRKQTPVLIKKERSEQSEKLSSKGVPYGLIQNEQPIEQTFKTERGYKEMYLCKFKNMETPKKNQSLINTSLSRSRIKSSIGSSKKYEQRPLPSISLDMQMKVMNYLKEFSLKEENLQLFNDPFRNGLLLCWIVKKQLNTECFASRKPKSIDDCRNNFMNCIETMKTRLKESNCNYETYIEQLVKGQKSLLYGLIWQLIKESPQNSHPKTNNKRDKSTKSAYKNIQSEEEYISWIRMLQKISPEIASLKIRNQISLFNALISTDFLYFYSWIIINKKTISSNYPQPINNIQKESNLKKIIGFLVQHKIIRSDYLWKTKSLMKKEKTISNQLVNDLHTYYNHLYNKEQMKTINFIKYTADQGNQTTQKPKERLETTMANQTTLQHTQIQAPAPKIEVQWMRKLGFHGNLQLNNGVILCRLISKLTMKTIQGVNQNPQSRAQCLGNIRKAIKMVPKFKWDQFDVIEGTNSTVLEIYSFLKENYKHCYALKSA